MKKIYSKIAVIPFLAIFCWYCSGGENSGSAKEETPTTSQIQALERLPDTEAGNIVRMAIDWAGGWESWAGKKTVSYQKTTTYLDSTGATERQVRQLHQYQLHPAFKARMSWVEKGDEYVIVNNGQQAWKFKNGEEMTGQDAKNHAWNSSFGSHYVFSMPFKLADPGVILTYEGLDTLDNGQEVYSLKVAYEEGAGSSGGMHDWWYFFDPETNALTANFLDHGNGFSYTTYEDFDTIGELQIQSKRHSYLTNEKKAMIRLRTIYENEDIRFNVPLSEDLFEPLK